MTKEFEKFIEETREAATAILNGDTSSIQSTPAEMSLGDRVKKLEDNQWKLRGTVSALVNLFHMMKRKEPREDMVVKINEL